MKKMKRLLSCRHQWLDAPENRDSMRTDLHTVCTQMNIRTLGCAGGSRALGWKHRFSTDCKTEDHSGERRGRGGGVRDGGGGEDEKRVNGG